MKLYNSLSRKLEPFQPILPKHVGVYTCGPTVYDYVTIGNWRTYMLGDLVVRSLKYLGYDVKYVMNETDVGHLTGDNWGDADTGEDRLEKAAKRENKMAWDVAAFYIEDFEKGYRELNMTMPTLKDNQQGWCKATEHIDEQIKMVQAIEKKGYAYTIGDGIYFDTAKYEADGHTYGELSTIDQVKEGARVEPNPQKRNPRDFALWKFSPKGEKRHMEWDSPWGNGFPGWHIECSAMAIKYLGEQFDIHIGGEDLRSTHHPNEIAQAEAATGKKPFVKYWLHGAFLQVDGGRMGKSLGNAYTLHDVVKRGFCPMHLRYFYLTGHWRQPLNFTWESLEAARHSYEKLVKVSIQGALAGRPATQSAGKALSTEALVAVEHKAGRKPGEQTRKTMDLWERKFLQALEDDLNMPKVLAVVWELVKAEVDSGLKQALLYKWDQVLGLDLASGSQQRTVYHEYQGKKSGSNIQSDIKLTDALVELVDQREQARKNQNWELADQLRAELTKQGYEIEDTPQGAAIRKSVP